MSDNDEFINEYIAETKEHLEEAEECLLSLNHDPNDKESMNACFRSLHTIKGGAGFLGLLGVQHLAHTAEQLLEDICNDKLPCTTDRIDALLAAVSQLNQIVAGIEEGRKAGGEEDVDEEVVTQLVTLTQRSENQQQTTGNKAKPGTAPTGKPGEQEAPVAAIVAAGADDIPEIIRQLDQLELIADERAWGDEARSHLAAMAVACDEIMFADSDGIRSGILRIKEMAQQLPHIPAETESGFISAPVAKADDEFPTSDADTEVRPQTAQAGTNQSAQTLSMQEPSREFRSGTQRQLDDNALADYLSEMNELLDQIEATMLGADEQHHFSEDQIQTIFRAIHTIKGMSAYVGFNRLEQLTHLIETELMPIRDGKQGWSDRISRLLMDSIDALRALGNRIQIQHGDKGEWPGHAIRLAMSLGWDGPLPEGDFQTGEGALDPQGIPRIGDLLVEEGVDREVVESVAKGSEIGIKKRLGEALVEEGKATKEQVTAAIRKQTQIKATMRKEGTTRVNISRLDDLVNLVGELLIAQSMVAQDSNDVQMPRLQQSVGRMNRIVRDLQALSLSLRMVPLKSTFQKMARAVHDTARKLKKEITFNLNGEDTEIDRTLAEMLADPLLHMVRNAVDHGIENGETRLARGKPPKGHVLLAAEQTSDHVVIRLADDGGGLDPEKLRRKGIERGLISPDQQLTEAEAYKLIFKPGFSTAEAVTGISGRGVGMDVASKNIHALGGTIDIDSQLEKGTTFTIRLPLTTAILDAMLLRIGTQRYLIPITAIIEAVKPQAGDIQHVMGTGRVVKSRGQLLPLISLKETFGLNEGQDDPLQATILTIEYFGGSYALQIDELLGQQQVVIKPLGNQYDYHPGLAGSAIMGDGLVALIIDPAHLIDKTATTITTVVTA